MFPFGRVAQLWDIFVPHAPLRTSIVLCSVEKKMKIVKATLVKTKRNGVPSGQYCCVYMDCNVTYCGVKYYLTNSNFRDPWVVDSIMFVKNES